MKKASLINKFKMKIILKNKAKKMTLEDLVHRTNPKFRAREILSRFNHDFCVENQYN